MDMRLLEIHPQELKFICEPNKHSLCSIQLTNNMLEHVAFKVKTTSPDKYFVRPKVGIIEPNSTREFTVRMQAQKLALPDMLCKDRFLIQSTVVPADTTDEDITSSLFAKDGGKYIEEQKLGVTLVSPSISQALKEEEALGVTGPNNLSTAVEEIVDQEPSHESHVMSNGVDSLPPKHMVPGNGTDPRDVGEEEPEPASLANDVIDGDLENLEIIKDLEELKLKLSELELKLCEAQNAISKLKEEKQISIQENKFLQENFVIFFRVEEDRAEESSSRLSCSVSLHGGACMHFSRTPLEVIQIFNVII
ncbi:vesicle-associated protein 2-2-like isoform X1 [Cucurbita maxima]|uniref:Vesicle-associated protein 2-2-like isoform X1 n=1 Tax=Cucurbita maxima TaxID=3661 RepID=A0A6J1HUF3_CUCMA|nr:vesicle-associated protein 2-2-like isoform X1 [Cucurbita maxima]XP_022968766.1 vesicle-associated protein 2-2-like isoform X1 [Cucurbita maxima]XP_022968767.1 vesicle-associated protein 2-2-like isoform X1 [Cucurbita maxima]XP_022968768.1 vesicle-associated protein 2-2-like isoform X1 [Cucurbita maxima]